MCQLKFETMRRLSFILSFVVLTLIVSCIKDDVRGADLKPGDLLPDFEVVMSDGSVISDESLKGSVSVVVFFSTICPDCQQILPVVQETYDEYAPKGVVFALISRGQSAGDINAFWTEKGLDMPYSAQESRYVYNKFAGTRIPRVYICDKDGIIRYIFTDDPIPIYDDLMSSLESLIR